VKHSAEIERYMKEPLKLIDILDEVVKKSAQKKPSEIQVDRLVQFNEISKTIDRLKEAGAEAPDELRRLKIALSHDVDEYEIATTAHQNAVFILKELEIRLGNSLTEVRAALAHMTLNSNSKPKSRRYVKRTSPGIIAKEIKKALRQLGGSGKKVDVFEKMKLSMDGKFKPQDLERDSQGNLNWEKWTVAEKMKMIKAGVIKAGSGFGIWELRRK
jgi:hypothetical protein